MATAISEPANAATGTAEMPSDGDRPVEGDREHGAERRAGRDAERERRGQRIAQQPLEHDARGGEERADAARRPACAAAARRRRSARRRCRRTGSRSRTRARRSIERRPDERRQQQRDDGERAETGDRPDEPPRSVTRGSGGHRPPDRHDHAVAGRVTRDVRLDAVDVAHVARRQHVVGRPVRDDLAVAEQHQPLAERRRRGRDRGSRSTIATRARACSGFSRTTTSSW